MKQICVRYLTQGKKLKQESPFPPDPPSSLPVETTSSSLQVEATNASLSSVLVMMMMMMIMMIMTLSSALVVAGRSGHNCTEDGAEADIESGCTQFYVCSGDKVVTRVIRVVKQ